MSIELTDLIQKLMKVSFTVSILFLLSFFPTTVQAISNAETNRLSQEQFVEILPPWATPAIVSALQKNLPSIYQLKRSGKGYSLTNPSHGIEISFTSTGPQFRSGKNIWEMTMLGIGYEGAIQPVRNARMINDNGRMVYDRGDLSEWYVNSRWGVEQGFTVHKAPEKGKGLLVVELALAGVRETKLQSNNTLILTDASGQQIRYAGLNVFDADSKVLPARFALTKNILSIQVDDSGAKYPLIIDPWIQQVKLTANDGAANDKFGISVAVSGDTVVVGAPNTTIYDSGTVYVFKKPVDGWSAMTQTAKLTASDASADDNFGLSVSISGDTIVVGSPASDGRIPNTGAAYIFEKPEEGWKDMVESAKLTSSNGHDSCDFGESVSIKGDIIVVGASDQGINGFGSGGSAYVFKRPSDGWATMTETARLTASDIDLNDKFGWSTAIGEDTIVVGAPGQGTGTTQLGAVYVFEKPANGWATTTQTAKLTASDIDEGDFFGGAVSISGDTIVVGAPANDAVAYNAGAAYVFEKPANNWVDATEVTKLTASDGDSLNEFGGAVSICEKTIVVGAIGNASMDYRSGSVYVFVEPVVGWSTTPHIAKLSAVDGASSDNFGRSIALDGNMIVAGAPYDDDNGSNSGSAYISFIRARINAYTDLNGTLSSSTPSPKTVDYYSTAEFSFNADAGYHVASITGCGIEFTNSDDVISNKKIVTDVITADCTIMATFDINQNTVAAVVGPMGSLDAATPSPQVVNEGETIQFTFNADAGYHIATITGCGLEFTNSNNALTSKTISTDPFTESCVVTATFATDQYTVVATAGANGRLSEDIPSSQKVKDGQTVELTFIADAGYHIQSITGCGVDYTNSDDTIFYQTVFTDPFTESCNVSAIFAISQHMVIADTGNNGSLDPATPSVQYVNDNETVELTFNADTGYHIESITGCGIDYANSNDTVSSQTVITDPFTEACVVNAIFAVNQHTIIASPGENGVLDPAIPSPQTAVDGESKQIIFNAYLGYHVASITGCGINFINSDDSLSSKTVLTEPFTESCVVTAAFAINQHTVVAHPGEDGNLNEGTPLSQIVNPDGTVDLTFNAEIGHHVASISGCGVSFYNSDNSLSSKTVTTEPFTTSCAVSAVFAINRYRVNAFVQSKAHGRVDVNTPSPIIVEYGETPQFTFAADAGYHINTIDSVITVGPPCGSTYVTDDDSVTSKTITTDPIVDDCNILGTFWVNQNTVTASALDHGSLDVSTPSPQTVTIGDTVQFTFNADEGFHIATISGCGIDFTNTEKGINSKSVITDPFIESCSVSASFAINQYMVSASVGPNGTLDAVSPSPQTLNYGETAQFIFHADTGYHIKSIMGCGVDFMEDTDAVIADKIVTTNSIAGDCMVFATFAQHNNLIETTISFEGFPLGLFNSGVESKFVLSTASSFIKDGLSYNFACAFNGTQYLNILSPNNSVTIEQINGNPFNLISFNLAEGNVGLPYPTWIDVIGTLSDGGTVTESFLLDGINDGSGPLNDFQTVILPVSFQDLISVEFVGRGYPTAYFSIDNVVFQYLAETNIFMFMPAILSASQKQPF